MSQLLRVRRRECPRRPSGWPSVGSRLVSARRSGGPKNCRRSAFLPERFLHAPHLAKCPLCSNPTTNKVRRDSAQTYPRIDAGITPIITSDRVAGHATHANLSIVYTYWVHNMRLPYTNQHLCCSPRASPLTNSYPPGDSKTRSASEKLPGDRHAFRQILDLMRSEIYFAHHDTS
jgi:hypothetical protein